MSGGGFGGRNDMISSKFDAVSRDFIMREMLKRENASLRISENFNVNPKTLENSTFTLKPSQVNPYELQKLLRSTTEQDDCNEPELKEKLKRARMAPQEKSKYPMTASQTVGWFWKEGRDDRKNDMKWFQPLNRSEEVKYAEAYVMMTGKSPYANTRAGK